MSARPGGAGIVAYKAAADTLPEASAVKVLLREPGGTWGASRDALVADSFLVLGPAVSDRGDAVVAAAEDDGSYRSVVATRRAPGGGFGGVEKLFERDRDAQYLSVQAGMGADGETVVAWSFRPRSGAPIELWASVAPAGLPFHAPARIGELRRNASFALSVGSGGHAVLAFPFGKQVLVAERAPGGEFGPAAPVAAADDLVTVFPSAAVRADGGAVVGWHGVFDGVTGAVVRERPGPFRAPVPLAGRTYRGATREFIGLILQDEEPEDATFGASSDELAVLPRALITPDGRALLTWTAPAEREGLWWSAPQSATVPLAGGSTESRIHGSELHDAVAAVPVALENGAAAVAWREERPYRIHLGVEGVAPAPDPTQPRVRIGRPKVRPVLDGGMLLPVTCSAACDVRASFGEGPLAASGTVSLRRAGSAKLQILDGYQSYITTSLTRRVRVRYGSPGAKQARSTSFTVRVRQPDGPALPRARDVVARRDGDAVVVTWRTKRDAKRATFYAYLLTARGEPAFGVRAAKGGPRRFEVRYGHQPAANFVTLITGDDTLRRHSPRHGAGAGMRRLLLLTTLLLASPGVAGAAPFGELSARTARNEPACLRTTGAPGGLVHLSGENDVTAIEFLHADPSGITRVGTLPVDDGGGCPQVVARPNGAGIASYFGESATAKDQRAVKVALREPGGPWGASLDALRADDVLGWAPAVSDRGEALVAAANQTSRDRVSVVATRRAPGATFGGVETLFDQAGTVQPFSVQAGISAGGEAVVAWVAVPKSGATPELWAAVAPPGAAFHAAVRKAQRARYGQVTIGQLVGGRERTEIVRVG